MRRKNRAAGTFCTALHALLMMTAKAMLSRCLVLRFILALFFRFNSIVRSKVAYPKSLDFLHLNRRFRTAVF